MIGKGHGVKCNVLHLAQPNMHRKLSLCIHKCFSKHFIIYLHLQNNFSKRGETAILLRVRTKKSPGFVPVTRGTSGRAIKRSLSWVSGNRRFPTDTGGPLPANTLGILNLESGKKSENSKVQEYLPLALITENSRNSVILHRSSLVWDGWP